MIGPRLPQFVGGPGDAKDRGQRSERRGTQRRREYRGHAAQEADQRKRAQACDTVAVFVEAMLPAALSPRQEADRQGQAQTLKQLKRAHDASVAAELLSASQRAPQVKA